MSVTKEQVQEIKTKMEEAKIIYLKYCGALEVLESIYNLPEEPKKVTKTKK